jgi:Lon protease-like protein
MIDDTLKTQARLIGMIQPFGGAGGTDRLHSIGCAGRLSAFSETEDGRYMVTLSGVSRFRVLQEVEGFAPYRRCDVSWAGFERDRGPAEKDPGLDRTPFMELLNRFFQSQGLSTDWDAVRDAEDELLINSISMLCPFPPEDRQALLEAQTLGTRRETLVTLIEFALAGGEAGEIMQ